MVRRGGGLGDKFDIQYFEVDAATTRLPKSRSRYVFLQKCYNYY